MRCSQTSPGQQHSQRMLRHSEPLRRLYCEQVTLASHPLRWIPLVGANLRQLCLDHPFHKSRKIPWSWHPSSMKRRKSTPKQRRNSSFDKDFAKWLPILRARPVYLHLLGGPDTHPLLFELLQPIQMDQASFSIYPLMVVKTMLALFLRGCHLSSSVRGVQLPFKVNRR